MREVSSVSAEFSFIELDDAYSTGSSMMPQKRTDVAELIRGVGRVFATAGAAGHAKGLPLAYNKDMQEDKEALFDAVDTVKKCLIVFQPMLETIQVKKDVMAEAAQGGFTNATDLADYLVRRGMPFREAHATAGQAVLYCLKKGLTLDRMSWKNTRFSPLVEGDVYQAIDIKNA